MTKFATAYWELISSTLSRSSNKKYSYNSQILFVHIDVDYKFLNLFLEFYSQRKYLFRYHEDGLVMLYSSTIQK